MDAVDSEILNIAFPAALALAADQIASLIDTAFIGRLGPVNIATVGVNIAIFNQASKVKVYPLVSITTSFVAEEEAVARTAAKLQEDEKPEECSEKDNGLKPEDEMLENLENGDPSTDKDLNATAHKSSPLFCGKVNQAKSSKGEEIYPFRIHGINDWRRGNIVPDI